MDPAKTMLWKFPCTPPNTVIIGDSQTKYLHQHFDPRLAGTPAFITQTGACIADAAKLLDFVPDTSTTLVLYVGTNDLLSTSGATAFRNYGSLLNQIMSELPHIRRVCVSLVLPRSFNRRRGSIGNVTLVQRCNREAMHFNKLLRDFCRRTKKVFYGDHGFEWLPLYRVLAAAGLHPSFEGVSLLAGHFRLLCYRRRVPSSTDWQDCSSAPSGRTRSQTSQNGRSTGTPLYQVSTATSCPHSKDPPMPGIASSTDTVAAGLGDVSPRGPDSIITGPSSEASGASPARNRTAFVTVRNARINSASN
ncbi:hypothetical protein HPB49_016366 [Dermacentor silvarum]|uniref:Uncharacterized protein n=1 Tax=Dermacentor silvarum TaxID=543639 RepID=A0ACB8E1H0_DERSI|nr:hypothetical protein HPB49_016366 [Dermacentor silvarum]